MDLINNKECNICGKIINKKICGICSLVFCDECEELNHPTKTCVHCNIKTCSFITCRHKAHVCMECCDELNMHPVELVKCIGCEVICACARPSTTLLEKNQEPGIICELCLNVGFQCDSCFKSKKPLKKWPQCQECEHYVCNICGIKCNGFTLEKPCSIVCDRCISNHSWKHHNIFEIMPKLLTNDNKTYECSVCYEETDEMVQFPYCSHDPVLCKKCGYNMSNLKCVLNCNSNNNTMVDIYGIPATPLKLNNGKSITSKFFNKLHNHILHWKKDNTFECTSCNVKGRGSYSCNFCEFNVCVDCTRQYN